MFIIHNFTTASFSMGGGVGGLNLFGGGGGASSVQSSYISLPHYCTHAIIVTLILQSQVILSNGLY